MKQRFLLLGLCACVLACDSASPVAPSGTVLSVSANPTRIDLSGDPSRITVTGFKPDGNPLNPGTQVLVSSDIGDLFDAAAAGNLVSTIEIAGSGQAVAYLRGDGRPGSATVTATLTTGGEASATAAVQIGETPESQPQLSITASPSTINLEESATITAVARNADSSLFGAGGQVLLRTDLGNLNSSGACNGGGSASVTVTTDANSEAITTLCAGSQPGTATITGTFGSSEEATAAVTIENQKPVLEINANPTNISSAEMSTITVIARDQNNVPLGSGFRIQLLSSFGTLDPADPVTNGSSVATSTFSPGGDFGDAVIRAFLGSSDAASVTVFVRGDVERVSFTTIPQSLQVEDQEVRLVARAFDARNEGVASVVALFEVTGVNGRFELPGGEVSSDGSIVTNSSGDASIDLDLLVGDLDGVTSFNVKVSVTTEGGSVEDERQISVNQ